MAIEIGEVRVITEERNLYVCDKCGYKSAFKMDSYKHWEHCCSDCIEEDLKTTSKGSEKVRLIHELLDIPLNWDNIHFDRVDFSFNLLDESINLIIDIHGRLERVHADFNYFDYTGTNTRLGKLAKLAQVLETIEWPE